MSGEILFLAHRVPYPPDRGDKIRSWHMLKRIASIAPTHVVTLCDDPRDLAHAPIISKIAASAHFFEPVSRQRAIATALLTGRSASVCACASARLQTEVHRLLATRPIKTIFAYSGQMAQFVPPDIGDRRFVMDFVDMDSAKFAAYGGFANREEARRLRAFEMATAARADVSMFVSKAEADVFCHASGLPPGKIASVENGIDLDAYSPDRARPTVGITTPLIVFTGQMDYRPNIEAVSKFALTVMPIIRASFADVTFAIVGRAPTAEVMALGRLPGVHVTGEVPDTRDWLAAADVVVAPLLLARGIQNKILEAMAMAKPVVASSAAAQGIDATHGVALIVADGAQAQSDAVIALLNDPAHRAAVGIAARQRMVARYSWEARLADLPSLLGFAA